MVIRPAESGCINLTFFWKAVADELLAEMFLGWFSGTKKYIIYIFKYIL